MTEYPADWSEEQLTQLGKSLREAFARPSAPGCLTRWLHGPRYTDIFVDIAPGGEVARLEVSFAGHYFLYQYGQFKTGMTDEMSQLEGAPQSRMVTRHPEPDPKIVAAAACIIRHLTDRFLADFLAAVFLTSPARNT